MAVRESNLRHLGPKKILYQYFSVQIRNVMYYLTWFKYLPVPCSWWVYRPCCSAQWAKQGWAPLWRQHLQKCEQFRWCPAVASSKCQQEGVTTASRCGLCQVQLHVLKQHHHLHFHNVTRSKIWHQHQKPNWNENTESMCARVASFLKTKKRPSWTPQRQQQYRARLKSFRSIFPYQFFHFVRLFSKIFSPKGPPSIFFDTWRRNGRWKIQRVPLSVFSALWDFSEIIPKGSPFNFLMFCNNG